MKGKVRSRERYCPEGHGRLRVVEEFDIKCTVCNYRPKIYFIDLYWHGRYKICRGKDGEMLTSYPQAHRLLENIRFEIDARTFSISRYLPKEIDEFRGRKLFSKWLDTKTLIAPSTLREYKRYVRLYFIPFFDDKDMRDIRSAWIEDFLFWLPGVQAEKGYKPLSLKTIKNIFITLHNFCTWLYKRETIARIPDFPEIKPPEPAIDIISRKDQLKIIAMMPLRHWPIFRFLVYHPVRPGEVRALKRKCFDLGEGLVQIAEAFSLGEIRSRKNKKPYYLPISRYFDIAILKDKLPEAFVFTNKDGRPYHAGLLRRIWHKARKKAQIPYIKLYNGTRHSTASEALKESGSRYKVSLLLGHADQKMTEKYIKRDVQMLRGLTDDRSQIGKMKENEQ